MTQLTGYDMTVGVKLSVTKSILSYYRLFNLHLISFVNFFQSRFVIQATVHVTFFFIPAFRCFKVNSYFVGTCKRKIRVEQVKSPKKTLFVCLFFH